MTFVLLSLIRIASGIIIVDAVLSWVQSERAFPRSLTTQLTAPLYAPVHAVVKPGATGGIDFAPLIVLVLLNMVGNFIAGM